MRWIKHMTATSQDEKIARLIAEYGHASYGIWWLVVEAVAARLEKGSSDPSVTYHVTKWSHLLSLRGSHVRQALLRLELTHLVTAEWVGSDITVTIPNLLKYRDEYQQKSGHAPDNVGSKRQRQSIETETETEKAGGALLEMPSAPTEEDLISEAAKRLCVRHPPKRTCTPGEARKHLKAIIGKLPKAERARKLESIDTNHQGWCLTEDWTKENGEYAKGLANWLAPTMERYDAIPPKARDSPPAPKPFVPPPWRPYDPKTLENLQEREGR